MPFIGPSRKLFPLLPILFLKRKSTIKLYSIIYSQLFGMTYCHLSDIFDSFWGKFRRFWCEKVFRKLLHLVFIREKHFAKIVRKLYSASARMGYYDRTDKSRSNIFPVLFLQWIALWGHGKQHFPYRLIRFSTRTLGTRCTCWSYKCIVFHCILRCLSE